MSDVKSEGFDPDEEHDASEDDDHQPVTESTAHPVWSCVGLPDPGRELPRILLYERDRIEFLGWDGPLEVSRWQDPSGARIVMAHIRGSMLPWSVGFETLPGVRIGALTPIDRFTAVVEVMDRRGHELTSMGLAIEQGPFLKQAIDEVGMACVAVLGFDVIVHANEAAFRASPDARLGDGHGRGVVERSSSSFLPHGLFGDGSPQLAPYARLTGSIGRVERRTTEATGLSFFVASVSCMGFDLPVCLSESRHRTPPEPGNIISGEVFMLCDIPRLAPGLFVRPHRRTWFRR